MASIQKRKNKNGTCHWRAVVRIKGYPTVCNHYDRKQEAEDWAAGVERQIKMGQFKFDYHKAQYTFSDLLDRYIDSGILENQKSTDDTLRHLNYWKERFKAYALAHLTAEFIAKERRLLLETPTDRGTPRSPSTVNRYMSSLSAILTYCSRELSWINENPCFKLVKLKEPRGRDRVLTEEEAIRLLETCRQSKNPYLYCIVLIALTTGMRQSEILGLTWNYIDFDNQLAHLKETKNGRARSCPLVDEVIKELQKFREKKDPKKPLIFASKTAFGKLDIKKAWQMALTRANITGAVFHSLRHTFTTFAARQGASTLELQTATGHRSLSALMGYTHLEGQLTRKFSDHISEQILQGESA